MSSNRCPAKSPASSICSTSSRVKRLRGGCSVAADILLVIADSRSARPASLEVELHRQLDDALAHLILRRTELRVVLRNLARGILRKAQIHSAPLAHRPERMIQEVVRLDPELQLH